MLHFCFWRTQQINCPTLIFRPSFGCSSSAKLKFWRWQPKHFRHIFMGLWFIATIYLDVRRCSALWYVFNRECSELLSIYWICPLIMKRSLTFAIWTLLYYGVEQPKKIGTFEILQHVLFLLQPGKCDETKVERKIHKKKQRLFLNHINNLIGVHFFWKMLTFFFKCFSWSKIFF